LAPDHAFASLSRSETVGGVAYLGRVDSSSSRGPGCTSSRRMILGPLLSCRVLLHRALDHPGKRGCVLGVPFLTFRWDQDFDGVLLHVRKVMRRGGTQAVPERDQ
jgi:hypothetical protein